MKTQIQIQLDSLFNKLNDTDYFGYAFLIEQKIKEWEHFCSKGDKAALCVTKDQIIENIKTIEKNGFNKMVDNILKWIDQKDTQSLIKNIRYDQKASLSIYLILTGDNLKGFSNKVIEQHFVKKYSKHE